MTRDIQVISAARTTPESGFRPVPPRLRVARGYLPRACVATPRCNVTSPAEHAQHAPVQDAVGRACRPQPAARAATARAGIGVAPVFRAVLDASSSTICHDPGLWWPISQLHCRSQSAV